MPGVLMTSRKLLIDATWLLQADHLDLGSNVQRSSNFRRKASA